MSRKSYMLGKTGPFNYDPALDYKDNVPITAYTSAGVITFVVATSTAPQNITDANSLFLTAPNVFYPGALIEVRGSANNDGYYEVTEVAAGTLTLSDHHEVAAEAGVAGDITISTPTQAAFRGLDGTLGSSDETSVTDTDNDTGWETERTTDDDIIYGKSAGTDRIQIDVNGVTLEAGASINEFSVDGIMAGDSDDAVPTEQAVRSYGESLEQYAYFTGGF